MTAREARGWGSTVVVQFESEIFRRGKLRRVQLLVPRRPHRVDDATDYDTDSDTDSDTNGDANPDVVEGGGEVERVSDGDVSSRGGTRTHDPAL